MACRRSKLTLIFIYVILFFALCAKPISSHRKDAAPSPAPSKDKDKESESDFDTPGAAPSSGPSADSPLSVSELFELSMPEIGVQKSSIDQNNDGTKMVITQLEGIKKQSEWYKTWFAHKGSCPRCPPEVKKCCDQCQENLDDAIDGVKVSTESINKQDLAKAKVDISGIATDIQTCNDCFVNGEDKDVRAFNWWAKGAIEECINSLKNAEIGVQKIGVRKSSVDQ
nr:hypothetical protein [Tanacetum cinerariifolium]